MGGVTKQLINEQFIFKQNDLVILSFLNSANGALNLKNLINVQFNAHFRDFNVEK